MTMLKAQRFHIGQSVSPLGSPSTSTGGSAEPPELWTFVTE